MTEIIQQTKPAPGALFNFFLFHGTMMWLAWSVFAIIQVSSNRYFKGRFWKHHLWIHRVTGALMMLISLGAGIKAWQTVGWKVIPNYHAYFAFPVLFFVTFAAIGGITTKSMLRNKVWDT